MSNIANVSATIAAVITAIGGLIYIWKESQSLTREQTKKLKSTINKFSFLAVFVLGPLLSGAILVVEIFSPDPIGRVAAFKISAFTMLLVWWPFMYLCKVMINSLRLHSSAISTSIDAIRRVHER